MEFLRAKFHDLSSTRDRPTAQGATSQPTPTPTSTVSSTTSEADTSVITGEEGWEGLCTRAMESQPSYAVAFEVRLESIVLPLVVIWPQSEKWPASLPGVLLTSYLGTSNLVPVLRCTHETCYILLVHSVYG